MIIGSLLADSAYIFLAVFGDEDVVDGSVLIGEEKIESLFVINSTSLILVGLCILSKRWARSSSMAISLTR